MVTAQQFYQLSQDPFAKQIDTKDAYRSSDFTKCAQRMDFLAKNRGLALITAAPGYGKSLSMRAFAKRQNPNLVRVVYVCMTTLSVVEFYRQLASELGLEATYRKAEMYKEIQGHIDQLSQAKKVHLVLIIDEAQYLSAAVLKDIKMLMNFDYDSSDRFSLVLCGQPVLADLLSRQIHEALRQRITVNYGFSGLSESEAREYASAMLQAAGGSASVFDDAAVLAAYNCSNGSVRMLGRILGAALTIGAQNSALSITPEMVMSAADEVAIR